MTRKTKNINLIENQLNYWRQQLADAPPLLELPTDRPRPATQSFNRAHHVFILPQSLSKSLKTFNTESESSLFMTLLSTFATLLFRYSGQSDILIGSPTANRDCEEIESQISLFVNTLVLRLNLSDNPTFKELLSKVQQVTLKAQEHQDLPFEQLVEVLQPEPTLSHHPLFQVMFVWRNTFHEPLALSGVNVTSFEPTYGLEQLDLTLEMCVRGLEIVGNWNYNTDLFDETTIQRMTGHFQTLLEGVVANPLEPIETLPLLTEGERQQLLVAWNETKVEHQLEKCVHNLFEEQVAQYPDTVAAVFGEAQLTYHQLNQRANQLAHYLIRLGVGAEVLVGVFLDRSLEAVVTLLAVFKAGGAYLPLDPTYPQERLAFMLEDAQASLLLTQQKWLVNLPPHQARVICLDTDQNIAHKEVENPSGDVTGDRLAYVIYTSGSTGKPKGVLIEHRSLTNMIQSDNLKLNTKPGDRLTHFSSLSFDASIAEIMCPLCAGARLYVLTPEQSLPGSALLQLLKTQAITHFFLTPSVLAILSGMEDDFPALKVLLTFGEACSPDLVTRWSKSCRFYNVYGPTEFTIAATIGECTDATSPPPIGRPYDNTQAYLLDNHLQPVPIGIPGELYLGGVQLARGYLNQPALTEQKFIPNPFVPKEYPERLYKTGDLAYYRPDGNLVFVGRVDEMVKIRGLRVELGEIETVLNKHPAVQQAVVVAHKDTFNRNQHLVAYVVPLTSMPSDTNTEVGECVTELSLTSGELSRFANNKLPAFMVPATFVFLSKFPLTPSGKVDRRALPMPDLDRLDTRELVAPRTETEETIAAIWREILQLEQVGVYENFFELGGHSLLATQVALRMQKAFQVNISIRVLFEQHTIAALANIVDTTTFKGIQSEHPIVRVSREREIFPSFAQERLWFLNQLEGPNATYNIFDAWFLEGPLNITALEQSLTEIVRRHESLRTTFAAVKGQPTQIIHPTSTVKLEVVELLIPEVEKQAQVQRWVAQESQYPFDLEHDSLLRVTLLRTAPEEHYLLLTIHHIISDGWSMGIFMKELSALYKAFIKGEPVPLTALSLQYADFAHWQRGWLQGEVLSNQLNYWKAQLADAPPLLELPTDHPRPAVQSGLGASHKFTLPKGLSEQLKAFSSQSGTTLFMVLQAAFAILLHRYSAQEKILVGTPSANRNHLEIESLIGFFVNMLVLPFNLSGNPTFNEFLFQVRQVALEAYSHQDLPFEQLVDVLQPKRSLSHSPLFQVAFGWQDTQFDSPNLFGLTVTRLEVEKITAKFDLTLLMEEHEQGLRGEWEYSTDLFEPDTIQRMNGHFQTLLQGIVANPQQHLSSLPLLTEAERHQLLFEWNNTQTEYPQDKCIHELFEKQVELRPNAVAVIFEEEQLTYQELNARANQLAHHLQTLGVGPEVLVGICVERSLSMVVGLLGILKAGGAYVPLDPAYPSERLAFMLEDSAVPVLLTQAHLVEKLPIHQTRVICLENDSKAIAQQVNSNPTSVVTPHNLAYVMYTSGSTGKPKGVSVIHKGVVRLVKETNYVNLSEEVFLQFAPISFDASTFEIWGSLLNGGRLAIAPPHKLSLEELGLLIAQYQVTTLWLTAGLFHLIADEQLEILKNVRQLLAGGDVLSVPHVKKVLQELKGIILINGYGPTENTTFTCCYAITDPSLVENSVPIGRPIANTEVYLLDEKLQPVPIGVPGELYIGGDGLARGYLNRPDLSLEKFIPNPFSEEPGSRLYKTGDLARYLPDGNIEFLGRIDNQVKVRGFRIELGEIEAVLTQHPQILKAVVIVREDNPGNKYLAAYLVPELYAAAPPKSSELRSFLKAKLPDYMIPGTFVFLEAMPLTPNGKVDRSALPAPDSASFALSTLKVPPQSPLEEDLVNIWREVLGIEQIGTQDDFFTLGGHSLLATQIISRVREHFHVAVPLRSLFENPTVAGLAQRLDTLQKAKDVFVTSEVVSCFPNVEDYEEGEL